MRGKMLVLGLTVGALSVGCYYHRPYYRYGYGYGYYQQPTYTTTYQDPNAQPVQQQPPPQGTVEGTVQTAPPPTGVTVTATATVSGEGISGSDGTHGWRVVVQSPQQEFQRLSQVAAQQNCQVEASTAQEVRAVCNGVHIVVRFDQQHVYKLCAPNTDVQVCARVWSAFGG